jgi:hypothetical protein
MADKVKMTNGDAVKFADPRFIEELEQLGWKQAKADNAKADNAKADKEDKPKKGNK